MRDFFYYCQKMDNSTIADQFALLAKLMALHEENPFKIRSYSNAAFQIERLPKNITEMPVAEISSIPGIGPAIQKKIEVLSATGRFPLLEKYLEDTPSGVLDMLHIKGIGPKKLSVIWKKMGIETAGELLYACNEDRLTRYKGFGAKTQESIRKTIEYYLHSMDYYLYAEALAFSETLLAHWQSVFGQALFVPTGHLRRQSNIVSTLEYVTDLPADQFSTAMPEGFTLQSGETRSMIFKADHHPKVVLHSALGGDWGSLLFQTTGSTVFVDSFYQHRPELVHQPFASEESLFQAAGFPVILPPRREYPVQQLAACPDLIRPEDIKGIIHSHSTWSDGKNSIEQMALAAKAMGMEYLVISDHSRSAAYARGLQVERVAAQHREIDALNQKMAPFKIFKSIESDILLDGSLDYEAEILKTFDLVIASVHSSLKMDEHKATERLLTAIANPFTTILGHPTGRLLLSREGYPVDHHALINACVENNVAIEINAHPRRLDMDWHFIPYALQQKAMLSIDPDAHSVQGMEAIHFGVWSAQKGGLTPASNLSSLSLNAFENYLSDCKRKKTGR